MHPILKKKKRVDIERSLIWSMNSATRCVMANLNCSEGMAKMVQRRQGEAGFHQQLDNDHMYFRFLMAMDLHEYLIFGRVSVEDIL